MQQSITSGQKKQMGRVLEDALSSIIASLGLSREEAQRVLEQGNTFEPLLALTVCQQINRFPITVDYSKSKEKMFLAGRYQSNYTAELTSVVDRVDCPKEGVVMTNASIFHNHAGGYTDELKVELHVRGLRPATFFELLAFGAAYPEMQRQFPIVALGSRFESSIFLAYRQPVYPTLTQRNNHHRIIELQDPVQDFQNFLEARNWLSGTRFLLVPKQPRILTSP